MLLKQNNIAIQQAALLVCQEHGDEAEAFALSQMKDFMERDDAKKASYWMAVLHEIKCLPSSSVN